MKKYIIYKSIIGYPDVIIYVEVILIRKYQTIISYFEFLFILIQ